MFKQFREALRIRKLRKEVGKRDAEVRQLILSAKCLTGTTMGGVGYSEEDIKETMDVNEIKSALLELAEIKTVKLVRAAKDE